MAETFNGRNRIRKKFGKIREVARMPNLIEVQKSSYDDFLMVKEPEGGREDAGLQAVFKSVFPISDFSGRSTLEFVHYDTILASNLTTIGADTCITIATEVSGSARDRATRHASATPRRPATRPSTPRPTRPSSFGISATATAPTAA